MIKASERFVSLAVLTKWIGYALYLAIALSLIGIAFDLNEYRILAMLRDHTFGDADVLGAQARLSDVLMRSQGLTDFALQVALYFLIGRWIYRAAWNARHLGASMKITPGWAVGWYFVPFAALVMPFRAMREIWEGSHRAEGSAAANAAADQIGLLRWWWALFLITSFIGNALMRVALSDDDSVSTLIGKNLGATTMDFLSIPLNLVFIAISQRIARAQDRAQAATPDASITQLHA
jgi:hypothetical protein